MTLRHLTFYLTKNAKATKLTLQALKFTFLVSSILDFVIYNFEIILSKFSFVDSNFKFHD